jgi:adenosine kinase
MKILLSGSIAFDYLMTFPGYFRDHILPDHLESISLSFLVDSMVRVRGGIAPNIAYTMALLGQRPRLWATVGIDFEEYRQWLECVGIDTSGARVIPGIHTASFFVNTDRSNAQIASFYPGAMGYATQLSLLELADQPPDLVVISPNDPAAMIQYTDECNELGVPYFFDPSQQIVRLTPDELRRGALGARAIFANDYESALMEKATGMKPVDIVISPDANVEFIVITRGKKGASIFTAGDELHLPVVEQMQIVDPTGVGDAFRGGFLTGYAHGFDLEICGQMGSLAATYCLERHGSQGHKFTRPEFVARFREHFDDGGKLDQLLENDR